MKKILTLVCFCLMLPLVTHAAWWNPTTWETFSFFGWKISREAPVEVKKTVEKISEVKTVATPTEMIVIMATTSKEKKVEKFVEEAKRIVPVVKKVVELPAPVVEKNREPEPVLETIFTSEGYVKINLNEYNKFSSDNGQNVVYVNKKNGSRIVPKSTQNYLDAQIQKQQELERQAAIQKNQRQTEIQQQAEIDNNFAQIRADIDYCANLTNQAKAPPNADTAQLRNAVLRMGEVLKDPRCTPSPSSYNEYMNNLPQMPKTTRCSTKWDGLQYQISCTESTY